MSTTVEIAPGPDLGSLKKQPATAVIGYGPVSYTHLTLPTNREV